VFFVSIYSNIVILGTSVLFAGDMLPRLNRTACSLAPHVLQVGFPSRGCPNLVARGFLLSQQNRASVVKRSKASVTAAQPAYVAASVPPFLRRPILFGPNSIELTAAGRDVLKRSAAWLQQHHEARILIVGSCDSSGSETCTLTLAEARGAVAKKFLGSSGIGSAQIVGVKGWDNRDHGCQTSDAKCQQLDRSTLLFMASSVGP
jgi:outer membrane protein OmpA-like peptidoglycan-associated protein